MFWTPKNRVKISEGDVHSFAPSLLPSMNRFCTLEIWTSNTQKTPTSEGFTSSKAKTMFSIHVAFNSFCGSFFVQKHRNLKKQTSSGWWFQPSKWKSSPGRGEYRKYLKPPPHLGNLPDFWGAIFRRLYGFTPPMNMKNTSFFFTVGLWYSWLVLKSCWVMRLGDGHQDHPGIPSKIFDTCMILLLADVRLRTKQSLLI